MTWGYTFGYRRRAVTKRDGEGKIIIEIPQEFLELMGIEHEGVEVSLNLREDGSTLIRKTEPT